MKVRRYVLRSDSSESTPRLPEAAEPWVAADSSDRPLLTVSELALRIQGLLAEAFTEEVWVQGELSDPKLYPSGHLWFDLKDEQAALKAVMWRDHARRLRFRPEQGLQVICLGRVEFYPRRGEVKFSVRAMEPKGMGALQLAFEQLKEKLQKEGLFAEERKRALPAFPERVGLVTSPQGAAIDDMLRILRGHVEVVLRPTRVQGEGAAESIARGIHDLNDLELRSGAASPSRSHDLELSSGEASSGRSHALDGLDLVIVGRGGGSLEDLWAFNEEAVARAIFHSRLPVISAVGHEKDVTISDLVADVRAPTPTKGAELVRAERRACLGRLASVLEEPAFIEPERWVEEWQEEVEELERGLVEALAEPVQAAVHRLQILNGQLLGCSPQALILHQAGRLHQMEGSLSADMVHALDQLSARVDALAGQLHALSPLAVLERGYSITSDPHGGILRQASQVNPGEEIQTRLHRGRITSRVEQTEGGIHD